MVVARPMGIEAGFQVSQTFTACDLRIKHGAQLTPAGKPAHPNISSKTANLFFERRPRQKSCQLSKDCVTMSHSLRLLRLGFVFCSYPSYTVVYRSASLFSFFFPRHAQTCKNRGIPKHVFRRNFPIRKNAVFHLLSVYILPCGFSRATQSPLIHNL